MERVRKEIQRREIKMITPEQAKFESKKAVLDQKANLTEKELAGVDFAIRIACSNGKNSCSYDIRSNGGKNQDIAVSVLDCLKKIGYVCRMEIDGRATDDFYVIKIEW